MICEAYSQMEINNLYMLRVCRGVVPVLLLGVNANMINQMGQKSSQWVNLGKEYTVFLYTILVTFLSAWNHSK